MIAPEFILEDNNLISTLFFDLSEIDRKIGDIALIEKDILRIVFQANERQSFSQGRYSGQSYAPLSPRYADYKARHSQGDRILVDTGVLFETVTGDPQTVNIEKVKAGNTTTEIKIAFDNSYLVFHELGTKYMPARPALAFIDDDSERIADLIIANTLFNF